MRVGLGYDMHRLVPGRKLILGGVEIPFEKGLFGHSDADVLVHAVCDALLGAALAGVLVASDTEAAIDLAGFETLASLVAGVREARDPITLVAGSVQNVTCNATIRDYSTIGEGTLVGMGACLTVQKTEPWSVYSGNPAKKLRDKKSYDLY